MMPLSHRIATACAVALPWIHPWAPGPSNQVVPWLVALACSVFVLCMAVVWPAAGTGRSASPARWGGLEAAVAWGWAAAGVLGAMIGLIQYAGLSGDLPKAIAGFISLPREGQAVGNVRQPNQFASQMVIGSLAVAWLWCTAGAGAGRMAALATYAAMTLMALANVATGSRTGMLLQVVACVAAAAWAHGRVSSTKASPAKGSAARRARWLAGWSLCAYAAGLAVAPLIQRWSGAANELASTAAERMLQGSQACSSRVTLWSNVIDLIASRPWTGYGIGGLDRAHYEGLFEQRFCDILDHAHNLPLHLAVELGLPAALTICAVVVAWVIHRRPWGRREQAGEKAGEQVHGQLSTAGSGPVQQPSTGLAWAVVAVIAVHSMVEHPLWHGPFALALLCAVMLIERGARAGTMPTAPPMPGRRTRVVGLAIGASALAYALLAYAAFDYNRASQLYIAPPERDRAYRHDTLAQARRTVLFRDMVEFAHLTTTPVTSHNAQEMHDRALSLLGYSPEPRVIEKLLDSASLLGLTEELRWHEARFAAAFPDAHAAWKARDAVSGAAPHVAP